MEWNEYREIDGVVMDTVLVGRGISEGVEFPAREAVGMRGDDSTNKRSVE